MIIQLTRVHISSLRNCAFIMANQRVQLAVLTKAIALMDFVALRKCSRKRLTKFSLVSKESTSFAEGEIWILKQLSSLDGMLIHS